MRNPLAMKTFLAVLCACCLALPAMAARQFPAPAFVRAVPEAAGDALAASRSANKVLVADAARNRVAVVDDALRVTYLPVGPAPRHIIAVGFGFITSNAGDGSLSMSRDLATVSTIPAGGSGPMVADLQGRVLMLRPDGIVVIVDPATFTIHSFDTGLRSPVQHVVTDNGLVVADAGGEIRIFAVRFDGAQQVDSRRVDGRPGALVWDISRRLLYVLVEGGFVTLVELDLNNRTSTSYGFTGQGVRAAVIAGGMLFAGLSDRLVMLDLSVHYFNSLDTGAVLSIDVDATQERVFVLDANRNLRVIEPRTLRIDTIALPAASTQARFLFGTCSAYASGAALSVVSAPCGDGSIPEVNLEALWWVFEGRENGWGLNLEHQGSTLFGTWFTYDAAGQPTWLVMSNGKRDGLTHYTGELYRTSGPPFNAATFDPGRVTRTQAGTADVLVSRADALTFVATVDGKRIAKSLSRQVYSLPIPMCDTDITPGALPIYQGLWWNPAESGWGLNITHQANVLFITWFTYDTDGSPTWFVGSDVFKDGNGIYSGTLYKTFGPPMTASPWDPAKVTRMPVGNVTLAFRDDDNGLFSYTVNGVSGSKAITRQVFATPVTRCR
jgi:hypothetical protein